MARFVLGYIAIGDGKRYLGRQGWVEEPGDLFVEELDEWNHGLHLLLPFHCVHSPTYHLD
jgi:hypothetical protein